MATNRSEPEGSDAATQSGPTARPGAMSLRTAPAGMPDPNIAPPTIAESGDPFAMLRIVDLVARVGRGSPVLVSDLVDRLNATYPDWIFDRGTVVDALLGLQANWMADYRNTSGIVLDEGPYGPTLVIEDSSRVDPWIVRQADRIARDCRLTLAEFSRRDRPTGDG